MGIWREGKENRAKFIFRETIYFVCFFLLGATVLPLLTGIIGLPYSPYNIFTYLIKWQIDAWLLVLLPYLFFTIYRLRERAEPDSVLARVLLKKEDENPDNKVKIFIAVLIFLSITSALTYIFYPKPVSQSYYGDANECDCLGIEKGFTAEPQYWGENTEDWAVCFGVLYSCF